MLHPRTEISLCYFPLAMREDFLEACIFLAAAMGNVIILTFFFSLSLFQKTHVKRQTNHQTNRSAVSGCNYINSCASKRVCEIYCARTPQSIIQEDAFSLSGSCCLDRRPVGFAWTLWFMWAGEEATTEPGQNYQTQTRERKEKKKADWCCLFVERKQSDQPQDF